MSEKLTEISPASAILDIGGQTYDFNNISGAKRAQLVASGAVQAQSFVVPPNMPGKKLAEMRAQAEKSLEKGVKVAKEEIEKKFSEKLKVGSLVSYEGFQTEIIDLKKSKKGKNKVLAYITKKSGKKVWVPIMNLKELKIDDDIDDGD